MTTRALIGGKGRFEEGVRDGGSDRGMRKWGSRITSGERRHKLHH